MLNGDSERKHLASLGLSWTREMFGARAVGATVAGWGSPGLAACYTRWCRSDMIHIWHDRKATTTRSRAPCEPCPSLYVSGGHGITALA